MRKPLIAGLALVLLVAAGGGWLVYRRLSRDPLKEAQALLAKGDVQAAALVLRETVQRHPENAVAQVRLARIQLALGDPVAAERELRLARNEGYKGADLVPLLAQALLDQKRGSEVLATFAPDGLPPDSAAQLLVVRGAAQLQAGNAAAARASAEAAERLQPKRPQAALLAARAALAQGQREWALACVDRALALNPHLTAALLLKAGVLQLQQRRSDALGVLDQAVATASTPGARAEARMARARALLAAGQDAKALADLDAVLQQAPRNPAANYLKAVAEVRAGKWHEANAALELIQPELPRLPGGEYYLAQVKANLNELAQASDAIEHYTARFPADPEGWRLRARIDLLAGRKDDAATALARAAGPSPVQPDPDLTGATAAQSPPELTRLAALQLNQGDSGAAEQDLERSLRAPPSPADVAARNVLLALRAGDIARAKAALATLQREPKAGAERVATLTGAVRMADLDFAGARAAFADGLKAAPDSLALKLDLARVMLMQGEPKQAATLLAPALQKAPANTQILGVMLDVYGVMNDTVAQRAALAAARAARPDDLGLLLADAALAARTGDPAGALSKLDNAPATLAHAPQLLAMRVRLLLQLHRLKDAIAAQQQLLQAAPDAFVVRRDLIELLLADKQGDAALALARDGLKDHPGNAALLQTYVLVTYRVSGLDAALALADKLRHDPVNLPPARLLKGIVYTAAGRPADAAAAYAAERAVEPSSALVVAEAAALRAAGKGDDAIKLLSDWVAKQPDPAASDALAALEIQAKHLDAAVTALKDVLAVRPNDAAALNNLAWVYQQQHDPQALDLARHAYLLSPVGQTADTLGWILTQQDQPTTGLTLLRQAAAQLPRDPSVQYHLAVALDRTGQRAQAQTLLMALLARKPTFDEQAAARQLLQQWQAAPAPAAAPK